MKDQDKTKDQLGHAEQLEQLAQERTPAPC
jgi:hypothetical protein